MFFDRLERMLGRLPGSLEQYEFRVEYDAAIAVEQGEPEPGLSIVRTATDRDGKRSGFDVTTGDQTAHLMIDISDPRLLRLRVALPSGNSLVSVSTARATSSADVPELHLRAGLDFVAECFNEGAAR